MNPLVQAIGLLIVVSSALYGLVVALGRGELRRETLAAVVSNLCLGALFLVGDHGERMEMISMITLGALAVAAIAVEIVITRRSRGLVDLSRAHGNSE